MTMLNWYYILWSDAINFTRSSRNAVIWKLHTLLFISICMSFNLMIISLIFRVHVKTNFITLISNKEISSFLGGFLVFLFPPLLLNYFLIFHKNQWERIRKEYMHYNGRLYKAYFLVSLLIPASVLLLIKIAHDLFGFMK